MRYRHVYASNAVAFASSVDAEALEQMLAAGVKRREDDAWRFTREIGGRALAMAAARGMLLLVARTPNTQMIAAMARRVHGRWGTVDLAPDVAFAERMALRSDLHAEIVADIDKIVGEIRVRRIGADEKSKALLAYARILLPLSPHDANAVFHDAVEATSQLDREIAPQLRLLTMLLKRGRAEVENTRSTARDLSEALADAAIRLDGETDLPWDEVMDMLASLDLPLALANAAKWDDADLANFGLTLAPVLKSGLSGGLLAPASAMALELFLNGDHGVIEAALDELGTDIDPMPFLEDAAWDALIRQDRRSNHKLVARYAATKPPGRWGLALADREAFLATLPETGSKPRRGTAQLERERAAPSRPAWTRETLLDAEAFALALKATVDAAHASEHYISASELIGWAAESVAMRDRVAFLDMLCRTKAGTGGEIPEKVLELLGQWNSPAIRSWAATALPEMIAVRLPDFIRYIAYEETPLPRVLEWSGLTPGQTVDVLLRGLEIHGQSLGGDQVFALAGFIAGHLETVAAAATGVWYARRLAERVAPDDRDQAWLPSEIPDSVPVAVARLLYACMGDYDVRVRWRSAHAIRRLARLGASSELTALIDEYGRREETSFRSPRLDFYWIAARLWFVIAWDRIACEVPQMGMLAGAKVLEIAQDEDFPHLIIRSFARDCCIKLAAADAFVIDAAALAQLEKIGRSPLTPEPSTSEKSRRKRGSADEPERRFQFDPMDSIPYWYDPLLNAFADLSQSELLAAAETWILDRWGYPGEIRAYDKERRRHRFSDRDWSLTSNRHGSNPTLERLNNHLEWHGLWCAVGELLKTEALAESQRDDWDALPERIARELLTAPPRWSTDLRDPAPLRPDFWQPPEDPLSDWVGEVTERRMRAELLPADRPGYLLIGGGWRISTHDRIETVSCTSALVEPDLGGALVRALQTMDSAWNYSIPREGEDESDTDTDTEEGPYKMIGWLRGAYSDGGVDDLDPLRGTATLVDWRPGRRVREACNLEPGEGGTTNWSAPDRKPMFVYEVWGEQDRDDDRYSMTMAVAGRRLLVEREQLMGFLKRDGLELVIEVEVRREGRDNRRSYDSKDQTPEAEYDRLYRLDGEGALHAAEGHLGTWAGDRPAT